MIKFDVLTIFPNLINSFKKESILNKGLKKKLLKINVYDIRDYTLDSNRTVDDKLYGGGIGMVMKVDPIFKAVIALKKKNKNKKSKIILFTPRGKKFDQKMAYKFSKLDQLIMICGRYEGIDDRVAKHIADIELSVGDYVLMGGELGAIVVIESVSRLIPGVIEKPQLLKQRITKEKRFIEYPQYTRPADFDAYKYIKNWKACPSKFRKSKTWKVPKVLLSGNHKNIDGWRKKHGKAI